MPHSNTQAFRRGRKVGQTVQGRLVSPGPGGLFWVVVSGIKLLASLDHEPVPGRELTFRIEALEPELVLKDITPPPSSATEPGLLLAGIAAARTRFERHLPRFAPPPCPPLDLTAARRRFLDWLAGDAAARADFSAVQELFRLAQAFVSRAEGRPRYLPWVLPGLTKAEALTARLSPEEGGPGFRLRLFGHLPGPGHIAIEARHHPTTREAPARTVYRLMLERPQEAAACMAMLADLRFGKAVLAPACLSAGALPAPLAAGFLARIVAATSRPFTGLRLRV
ncbi:hypothetical protein [Solidesulfovibrio sp. C21]|uniref:hypothetical protein n=1 Tax=Solidesulfovibrio sp. C21 TaxID=3398613 RepID=UPI0039FCF6F7